MPSCRPCLPGSDGTSGPGATPSPPRSGRVAESLSGLSRRTRNSPLCTAGLNARNSETVAGSAAVMICSLLEGMTLPSPARDLLHLGKAGPEQEQGEGDSRCDNDHLRARERAAMLENWPNEREGSHGCAYAPKTRLPAAIGRGTATGQRHHPLRPPDWLSGPPRASRPRFRFHRGPGMCRVQPSDTPRSSPTSFGARFRIVPSVTGPEMAAASSSSVFGSSASAAASKADPAAHRCSGRRTPAADPTPGQR